MNLDLSSIETDALKLLAMVLATVAIWAGQRLVAWIGAHTKLLSVEQQAAVDALFSESMMKSSVAGVGMALDTVKAHGWDSVQVKNASIAAATTYAAAEFPAVLKAAGIDPSDMQDVQAGVTGALNRLFPQAAAIVAASPATPDASLTTASLEPSK